MSAKAARLNLTAPRRESDPDYRECLGNIGRRHWFRSGSPAERICPRCRRLIDRRLAGVGLLLIDPCRALCAEE